MNKIFILVIIISLSACSVIKVRTEDNVNIYRKFGFINTIEIPDSGTYVEMYFTGIGIVDGDLILGYKSSNKVLMYDNECTIFIDKNSKIDKSTAEYLKRVNCNFIYLHRGDSDE